MKKTSKIALFSLIALFVLAFGIGLYVLYQGYLVILYSV